MTADPLVRLFGDGAVLVELGDMDGALRLGSALRTEMAEGRLPDAEELVLGEGSLTVLVDPDAETQEEWLEALVVLARGALRPLQPNSPAPERPPAGDVVTVEVCFDGPDLDAVCAEVGWEPAQVIDALVGAPLEVAFVGFSPGFAYLRGLPPELAAVPRRQRPRPSVPAGSLALGGGFAAFYPQPTPGGWHLVGRTAAVLFDPDRPPYALLSPGQRLRVVPVAKLRTPPGRLKHRPAAEEGSAEVAGAAGTGGPPAVVVESPGTCTLVEDLGRIGVAELGVPRAGAMDRVALALANALVGNTVDEAALEVTAAGPRLRARGDLYVAVVGDPWCGGGVKLAVDGHLVPDAEVVPLRAGQVLEVGRVDTLRAVVALSGGVQVPSVLGSRSTDLLCGLGGSPLSAGNQLVVGRAGRPRGHLDFRAGAHAGWPATSDMSIRVVAGPDVADDAAAASLLSRHWLVAPESNRVGVRLAAAVPYRVQRPLAVVDAPSRGMPLGAVQLPPDGGPIILGPDHATVGGYPVVAVVVSADLPRLAHLAPGSSVRFEVVSYAVAGAARRSLSTALGKAVTGWFPTRAG